MIKRFRVQNYKALRDVSLELTPIHVLIGPNDSGKTSILQALASFSRTVDYDLATAFGGAWEGRDLVWAGDGDGLVQLSANVSIDGGRFGYAIECRFLTYGRQVSIHYETISLPDAIDCQSQDHADSRVHSIMVGGEGATAQLKAACSTVRRALSGTHYYRWNPRLLSLPVAPGSQQRFQMNPDGFGLALVLDDILGYDRGRFAALENRFRELFPEIVSIKLIRQAAYRSRQEDVEQITQLDRAEGKGIFFQLASGKEMPAAQASDGVLLVLAYLAVLYSPEAPRLLLLEEPENGIHPKRLQDVLGILRELVEQQSTTQVVLTTHSPYAVSLFQPEEVTLCTKRNGEVVVTRLSESKLVAAQQSLFNLGEIWTLEGDENLAADAGASTAKTP